MADTTAKKQSSANPEIEKLQEELELSRQETEDFKNKYLRALADYQNFEKRMVQQREEVAKSAESRVLLTILPFLDHLEQAEVFIKDQGLKMIKDQFINMLKAIGVQEIDVLNKEFDPYVAEAIDTVEGEKENINIEVVRKGYQYKDTILRVAQVKVSKRSERPEDDLKNAN